MCNEITDYNYIASSLGNAYYSGVSFEQLWNCISLSRTREELDDAISITIKLNELIKGNSK